MVLFIRYKEDLVALVVDEAHCVKLWGERFRTAFSELGTLRSLIPSKVNILALTAIATTETYHSVTSSLLMKDVQLISSPPSRDNLIYFLKPKHNLDELVSVLSSEFTNPAVQIPKTVLFIRRYGDCSDLYISLEAKLGNKFTDPPGYPNLAQFRRIEMYSSVLPVWKKEEILSTFSSSGSKLRLVIATSAFGLGVDIPDIRRIIHWGLPSTKEEYVQETGRAGRDGEDAHAILYAGKRGRQESQDMKSYMLNKTHCRRRLLFGDFLSYSERDIHVKGSKCCDICAKDCDYLCNVKE